MFFQKLQNPGTVPRTRVPDSPKNSGCPKVVPWDTNPWDSLNWDKNRWDSPGISSFGTQVPRTKIVGNGSLVPCPSLRFPYYGIPRYNLTDSNSGYYKSVVYFWSVLANSFKRIIYLLQSRRLEILIIKKQKSKATDFKVGRKKCQKLIPAKVYFFQKRKL